MRRKRAGNIEGGEVTEYFVTDGKHPGEGWEAVAGICCSFHDALAKQTGGRVSTMYRRRIDEQNSV
jgi:hypothetical protein